jgi:ureidoglycolate lyase
VAGEGVTTEQYLDPDIPTGLPWRDLPVVDARDPSARGLVEVVEGDPSDFEVPIVPWPVSGARRLDPGTGVEGGTTEGEFTCTWHGDRLVAVNSAVGGRYVIGYSCAPEDATDAGSGPATQVMLWHLNHHPDGGQLFASVDGRPFLVPVVPAGDDPDLDRAVAVASDGSFAVCVRPEVWHDGVYPRSGDGRFWTRQGRVHARVSADISAEFGCLLRVPLS